MRDRIIAMMVGAGMAIASADSCADTVKAVDMTRLKQTDVSTSAPQEQVFVESHDLRIPVSQLKGFENVFALSVLQFYLITSHRANQLVFDDVQTRALAIHAMLDGYDGRTILHPAADKALKSFDWLHVKDLQSVTDGASSSPRASGADSAMTFDMFYSITPDGRGTVVSGIMKLYSQALSPPANPYDPSSKHVWLLKPIATREYVYQSKLLQLPEKTPAIMDQLAAAADKVYDATQLRRDVDNLPPPTDGYVSPKDMKTAAKEKVYLTLIKDIRDPAWKKDDAMLMYAIMWSADDAALFKKSLQDGADSFQDLIP
ncbi:MAG: hypothetical protein ACREP9_11480, partial [Candidatus Dormibacteraceae bacterium]